MVKRSIVLKLGLTIILFSFIIIFPLGFSINKIFSSFYYNELEHELDELSSNYSKLITTLDDPNILNLYETLAYMINKKVFMIDHNGFVVVNSGFPGVMEGTQLNNEDLSKLKKEATIKKEYHDTSTQEKYLSIGKPIIHNNEFIGGIFIAASIKGIYASIENVERMIVLASFGSILIAIGIALFLSRRLSNPLLRIEETARKIAKGDLNTRVNISSKDEIGSLADAINDLARELKRYQTNRREFFANISHELRTPLTYIDGFTNALRKKLYKSEEEKEQMLDLVDQEAKRMTKLVNDLFELAKMEEGKMLLYTEPIDLIDIIDSAVSKTKLKAKNKGLKLEVISPQELPLINGDGLRLEQVMINLLENAIRYTENGEVNIQVWGSKDYVHLSIIDTGMGIGAENIPYLFERFFRVDKSRSRKLGGTGLGLAIVKQLVSLHNGDIKVKSEVGKGTRFDLSFPILKREE